MGALIVVLSVWFVWNMLQSVAQLGLWEYLIAVTLAVIGAAIAYGGDHAWWGLGLAGAAAAMMLVTDLLLVTTDLIRDRVLNKR